MSSAVLGDAHGIAVLDFGAFLDGSAREDIAKAMVDSFKRVGFVYLVNHGIPKDKIRTMFDWVRFTQPSLSFKYLTLSLPTVEALLRAADGGQAASTSPALRDASQRYVCGGAMWEQMF